MSKASFESYNLSKITELKNGEGTEHKHPNLFFVHPLYHTDFNKDKQNQTLKLKDLI